MRRLTILCDLDGIVVDLLRPWFDWYNQRWDDNLSIEHMTDYHIENIVKKECGQQIFGFFRNTKAYRSLLPLPGAVEGLKNIVDKVVSTGCQALLLTERGASFGYNNLVVDMRGLEIMRETGYPVIFDATHSVQLPGGAGDRSGGERRYVQGLARAAVAFGVDALFMEMHEDPDRTLADGRPLSDGPNMLRIDDLPRLLDQLLAIRAGLGAREGGA